MNPEMPSLEELVADAEAALGEMAARLQRTLEELAGRLRPFPAFWGMVSVQAVELEPSAPTVPDRGCLVVSPEGRICQLDLTAIPGIAGVSETDQVEELRELDLPEEEFILYAALAIRRLAQELRRRNQ